MEYIKESRKEEFMPIDEIRNNVLSHYKLNVLNIESIKFKDTQKQRAVYFIETNKGGKCLKKIFYDEENLLFIYSVIEWLNIKGISCPRLLSTIKGHKYVTYKGNIFILTDWIDGRKCDYDNLSDVAISAQTLARLHKSSKGFKPIEGSYLRKSNTNYYESCSKHFFQLMELHNKAFLIKDKFSKLYLQDFDYYIDKAKESVVSLSQIDFSHDIGDDVSMNAICHLDYVNKNIIFSSNNKMHIIDFDNTQMDMPVHDITVFLRRILKRQSTSWSFDIFKLAMDNYESVRKLSLTEYEFILAILMFPQKYWKISKDYYKNRSKCNHEAFINILKRILYQREEHEKFCMLVKGYIEEKFKTV